MKRMVFVLLSLFACHAEAPTQVLVRVRARADVHMRVTELRVRVATPSGEKWHEQRRAYIPVRELAWPIDIPVLPRNDDQLSERFEVIVEARDSGGKRIAEVRAITNFVAHHEKLLELLLRPCTAEGGALCLAPETCHGKDCASCNPDTGQCGVTPVIPGKSLPELAESQPDNGVIPWGDGGDLVDGSAGDGGVDEPEPPPHLCIASNSKPSQPFGTRRIPYVGPVMWPGGSEGLNDAAGVFDLGVGNLYKQWKTYLRTSDCGDGLVYVASDPEDATATRSDAHGYAMLILAYMAGHERDIKPLFDGMVRYYFAHPAEVNEHLMAARQGTKCQSLAKAGTNSEADMDIALALLLANKQWGSGTLDYYGHARAMIDAIRAHDAGGLYMKSGSRQAKPDSVPTSAFAPAHFSSFAAVSEDDEWVDLRDHGYALLQQMIDGPTGDARLWPDFVVVAGNELPRPAKPSEVETASDGGFGLRASRALLRMALRKLTADDPDASSLLANASTDLSVFALEGDPLTLRSSYDLKGKPLGEDFQMAFTAPIGPAAMAGTDAGWVTDLWSLVQDFNSSERTYFSDSIQLLSTLIMTGNVWTPEAAECPLQEETVAQPVLVLHPGSEGKDARLFGHPERDDLAGGDVPVIAAQAWTWEGTIASVRGLIDFDLSALPADAIITHATLKLYAELTPLLNVTGHSQLSGTNEVVLSRITMPWDEATVTWNTQPSVASDDELTLPPSTHNAQDYVIDVTSFIKKRREDPSRNFGIAMRLKTEVRYRAVTFASSDHVDANLHPRLEIAYSIPAP